jgi:polyphosphate kinase
MPPESKEHDFSDPSLYLHRELSLVDFQFRVLAQASHPDTPLLERLRFLTICSTNLDEFFEIRVAGLREELKLNITPIGPDGIPPAEALRRIHDSVQRLVRAQYDVLRNELLPALREQGICIQFREDWSKPVRQWVKAFFAERVLPVLTPVGLDPAHPFPLVLNKSLNFAIELEGKDAFGRGSRLAVVQAPRILPRLIALPSDVAGEGIHFVTLSAVIRHNADELFPGMKAKGCHAFRVTRNSDLWIDEEEVDNLLRALKGELSHRDYGNAVRLEASQSCPDDICDYLLQQFRLDRHDLYKVDGPVNLHRLSALYDLVDRPDLKYPSFVPAMPKDWPTSQRPSDLFARIRSGDIFLHHPFQSFTPVLELLRAAANDVQVMAIKLTLYRTGAASPLTEALIEAARNGKEVTAVVELRARFDEEANIDIATRLQEAGVKVVYGIVGYKAHAKMMLIVREEEGTLKRYVHLGTGNYHPRTTRQYTDFALMSCDNELGEDVHNLFQQLTGLGKVGKLKKLVQSPFALHQTILDYIAQETANARAGKKAEIRAKMNALTEPAVIRALYEASRAGVKIDLIVRGACCLRPGIPEVSSNIRVRSIVGRFLEHARVFYFYAGGEERVFCSSADWMARNFFYRVEVVFPIDGSKQKKRARTEGVDFYAKDNTHAWELEPDGVYRPVQNDDPPFSVQQELLNLLGTET